MKTPKRARVALLYPHSVPPFISWVRNIVKMMTGNSYFPSTHPALADVTTATDALEAAETAAKTRAKGTSDLRDAKAQVVLQLLHLLGAYVESVASTHPPEEQAAVIQSAGFQVHAHTTHAKQALSAVMGPAGLVVLRAQAAAKQAAYEWAMSADGGKTWNMLPLTNVAHTTVAGLTSGQTYAFRVRATVKNVAGDWTQSVSLTIH
jgi:hypothetical protein